MIPNARFATTSCIILAISSFFFGCDPDAEPGGSGGETWDVWAPVHQEASSAVDAADARQPMDAAAAAACAPPSDIYQPIEKLSLTGCVDRYDPKKFAATAIDYEVNSPLWSDSADKSRAFVLPDGGKIHVKNCTITSAECAQGSADNDKWVFPVGAVMIKNFLFDGKFVETRLFMHADDATWVGYSYQWDEAQTDATVVSFDRQTVMFHTGTRAVDWHDPNRKDCMDCHNGAAGFTLGLDTAQMNRVVSGKNQIDRLAAMELFDAPPPAPYKSALVMPYAGQLGAPPSTATVEQRARSYLQANCAFCHRPDGTFGHFDLRYDVPLKDTHICNAAVTKGAVGVDGGATHILVPGRPEDSALWVRMNQLDPNSGRMPAIGTYEVDAEGVKLVGDWISSLQVCPL